MNLRENALRITLPFLTCFLMTNLMLAQAPSRVNEQLKISKQGIQDNSFLIEEAYNQEEGVVQHISSLSYTASPQQNLMYVFTQEWPLNGQTHQISYTIPYSLFDRNRTKGIGDVLVNYRFQLLADDELAYIAPRVSVILPTGDESKGLGNAAFGAQLSVPASKDLSSSLVAHVNFGSTVIASDKTLVSYYVGTSLIWQFQNDLHFLLENLILSNAIMSETRDTVHETEMVINPGVRFAFNFEQLQIVSGIGAPITFMERETNIGILLYLSFEHPF